MSGGEAVELIYKGLFGDVSFLQQLSTNYINALVQIDAITTVLKNKLGDAYLVILNKLIRVDIASENANDDDIFTFIIMLIKNAHQYKTYTYHKSIRMYYDKVIIAINDTEKLEDKFRMLRLVTFVPFYIVSEEIGGASTRFISILMIFRQDEIDLSVFRRIANEVTNRIYSRPIVNEITDVVFDSPPNVNEVIDDFDSPDVRIEEGGYDVSNMEMIRLKESDAISQLLLYYDSRSILSYMNDDAARKYIISYNSTTTLPFSIGANTKNGIIKYSHVYNEKLMTDAFEMAKTRNMTPESNITLDVFRALRGVSSDDKKLLKEMMNKIHRIPREYLRYPWLLTATQVWANEQRSARKRLRFSEDD